MMANGLLEELRRISESSKDIPQEAINRLTLSALADLVSKVDKQTDYDFAKHDEISVVIEDVRDSTKKLSEQIGEISVQITVLTAELSSLKGNPIVSMGRFIKMHPKTALFLAITSVMAVIVLLSSKPFITLILTLAGVPSGAIEQILVLLSSS